MSPPALLYALVCNALLAAGATLLCVGPGHRGSSTAVAAALASLFATFGLERMVRDPRVRLLSVRTAVFAISYPIVVAALTALITILGVFARPGGGAGEAVFAVVFLPLVLAAAILIDCSIVAVGGGIIAAVITISFRRLFPEQQHDSA